MDLKNKITKILAKKENQLKIGILLSCTLILIGTLSFSGLIDTPFSNHLTTFQEPRNIPEGYTNTYNNSTNNEKTFAFQDDNHNKFIVTAVKDTNTTKIKKLKEPFTNETAEGLQLKNTPIIIQGHQAIFQTLTTDFMGLTLCMFHISWYCDKTGLTIISIGTIKPEDEEKMKKMAQSIKCHH